MLSVAPHGHGPEMDMDSTGNTRRSGGNVADSTSASADFTSASADSVSASSSRSASRRRPRHRTAERWPRLLWWLPLAAAGVAVAWVVSQKRPLGSGLGRWARVGSARRRRARGHSQSLDRLQKAIIGSTRQSIAQVFGLPRSVANEAGHVEVNRPAFWEAVTWYYPLRRDEWRAMAITFDNELAAAVQFIPPPAEQRTRRSRPFDLAKN